MLNHNVRNIETQIHTPETNSKAQRRILLVEDDRVSMEILATMLLKAGYQVVQAENGQKAWTLLNKSRDFHLVVTDRIMPEMDGMALFAKIKKDAGLSHIPVIMQTGATEPNEVADGILAGMFYYLTKPYQEQALLSIVQSAMRANEQHDYFSERITRQNNIITNLTHGIFHLRTLEEAQDMAFLLGSVFPRAELAVMGLYELLLNAIEHGMLEIGYDTKNRLLATSQWEKEIQKRLDYPVNKDKSVTVEFQHNEKDFTLVITDPGKGFEWQNYLQIEPARATKANGRGIAKANLLSFDSLKYNDAGNKVTLVSRRNS